MSVTFSSDNDGTVVKIQTEGFSWTEQADMFFNFLLAQGFYATEQDLSDYFAERAEEVGDLRSNARIVTKVQSDEEF